MNLISEEEKNLSSKIYSIEDFIQDGVEVGGFEDGNDEYVLNGRTRDIQSFIETTEDIDKEKRMKIGEDLCY